MPTVEPSSAGPVLSHVNLMVDTFINNASLLDLQATIRATLATSPPSVATAFTTAARTRLGKVTSTTAIPDPNALFVQNVTGAWGPAPDLGAVLRRARMLYGAGMGLAALRVLTAVIVAVSRTRWEADSKMENLYAEIDADVAQAIVSAKQEVDAGQVDDAHDEPARTWKALLDALRDCEGAVKMWSDELFPFERGIADAEGWKPEQSLGR